MADKCDAKFITDTYETFTCERPDDVHLRHRDNDGTTAIRVARRRPDQQAPRVGPHGPSASPHGAGAVSSGVVLRIDTFPSSSRAPGRWSSASS
ncbi:hypothetical protein ABZV14_13605 [Streptosporangium canum]|uniref:hypothetical protein n=1 Tax=Streptosporangium canum TaxID=324952 RepID=UPI0033BF45DB